MSHEDEIKALKDELGRLREQASNVQGAGALSANTARQREIIRKLADLGVQLG
ncbi:hypothetical protein [Lichenifustis flavocetrariae]|uniref:Uncharacterized protein n=1 Tax=Lichenifustis flavocetrariae TaxID=2949735 RepID=A0AA42CRC9_9HYPH|nr:hypothetical protein [Lichenifustis flavocetrariae]MCW6512350.1 hypothetical protein [Lichenifustis flavocetrariae]